MAALLGGSLAASEPETERHDLTGTGYGDEVTWQFRVSEGRRAGGWSTIPVPSCWELHGFGRFNYGHDDDPAAEEGLYRYRFSTPPGWAERRVRLVFEGVMTDAEVRLNGRPAGPVHRGAFTRFSYDVTELLRSTGDNELEVAVAKRSAEPSVNRAERDADYWVFGGIYRPVYLEARPREAVGALRIDARADGRYLVVVDLEGVLEAAELHVGVETMDGRAVGPVAVLPVAAADRRVAFSGEVPGARPWSAESPALYRLEVALKRGGEALHRTGERFGFRSLELRPGEGLFVNGRRVLLKGVNRHSFWPESGRTLNRALNRRDADLIKSMNMNAVRTAHYPPDRDFLEACDELGLYVIDELPGWHDAYATAVGEGLVAEMVGRDHNHPSVILWANGNEGGWNEALEAVFADRDLQRRVVLHPRGYAGGVEAPHYPTWRQLRTILDPRSLRNRWLDRWRGNAPVVLPTELLHGLYDGGGGAGLADYWELLRGAPRAAGGFLWAFADEAVRRGDRGGMLDSDGAHGPDGVLGPHREREGSFYAVRSVFAPVRLVAPQPWALDEGWTGELLVENRFDETDLRRCRFEWRWVAMRPPGAAPGELEVLERGARQGPAVAPGEVGALELPLPDRWRQAGALELRVRGPQGREVERWFLPTRPAAERARAWVEEAGPVVARRGEIEVELRADGATAAFDPQTGFLRCLGPSARPLCLAAGSGSTDRGGRLLDLTLEEAGASPRLRARYDGELRELRWRLWRSGWLEMSYDLDVRAGAAYAGVSFDLPERSVRSVSWLGAGPFRVWRNRPVGGPWRVWRRLWWGAMSPSRPAHNEYQGIYGPATWFDVETSEGTLSVLLGDDRQRLGLYAPGFPADARNAVAVVPPGLSILERIPAIGTKFHAVDELGPASGASVDTEVSGTIWLRVR